VALTRNFLKELEIEAEKIDKIIAAHTDTVVGLQDKADKLKEKADKATALEKQVEELKAKIPKKDWEAEFKAKEAELADYKAQVESKNEHDEKERLYEGILRSAGIGESFISKIMGITDVTGLTVKDGQIEDADKLAEKVKEDYAVFIPKKKTEGASVATPPEPNKTAPGADPEVVKRLQARHERLYGKSEE
jgi:predicted  nucleic acid-binding Zn-ribbon protein